MVAISFYCSPWPTLLAFMLITKAVGGTGLHYATFYTKLTNLRTVLTILIWLFSLNKAASQCLTLPLCSLRIWDAGRAALSSFLAASPCRMLPSVRDSEGFCDKEAAGYNPRSHPRCPVPAPWSLEGVAKFRRCTHFKSSHCLCKVSNKPQKQKDWTPETLVLPLKHPDACCVANESRTSREIIHLKIAETWQQKWKRGQMKETLPWSHLGASKSCCAFLWLVI